jgi:membrane protein implicated in regulation of membrane protease activity
MRGMTANRLMGVIEAAAALILGAMAVALAVSGELIAVLFAFGSLTFVLDWWRRSRKGTSNSAPTTRRER